MTFFSLSVKKILFLLLLCSIAIGCKESSSSQPKRSRLVLDLEANPNHIPLFVGKNLGFFDQEGILLEISNPASNNSLQLLENGQTELAVTYLPKVLRLCARKRDICVVGKIVEKPLNGFLVLQSSNIKTHQDFNGRVVGYCSARYSLPIFEHLLAENNIHLGSKIQIGEELVSHLISNKIDAAYGAMQNIQPFQLEALGYKSRFFPVTEFGMPEYEGLVIAGSKTYRSDRKLVKAFQKALQASIDYCRKNPQQAFDIYCKELNRGPKAIAWEQLSWENTIPILAQSQNFSYNKVKTLVDWLQDIGIMSNSLRLEPVILSILTTCDKSHDPERAQVQMATS